LVLFHVKAMKRNTAIETPEHERVIPNADQLSKGELVL
jgi:hypothetical protein